MFKSVSFVDSFCWLCFMFVFVMLVQVTCWERADFLVLLCVVFSCVFMCLIHIRNRGEVGTVQHVWALQWVFTDRSSAVLLLWILFDFYVSRLSFIKLSFLFLAPLWSPAGNGLTSLISCVWCFLVSLPVSGQVWYLIVSILDFCLLLYFYMKSLSTVEENTRIKNLNENYQKWIKSDPWLSDYRSLSAISNDFLYQIGISSFIYHPRITCASLFRYRPSVFWQEDFLSLPYLYIGKTGPVLAMFFNKSIFSIFQNSLSNLGRHNFFKTQCPLLIIKSLGSDQWTSKWVLHILV